MARNFSQNIKSPKGRDVGGRMKKLVITGLILSLLAVGLLAEEFRFNWSFTKLYNVFHAVDQYAHTTDRYMEHVTGFYVINEYYADRPDQGHGFINEYFGCFLAGVGQENGGSHNDALQSFKSLSTTRLSSLSGKLTPFVVEGIQIFLCEDRVKNDLTILLKNLEGEFSKSFWDQRLQLLQDIDALKESTFLWSNNVRTQYDDWSAEYDIPRDIRNSDDQKHKEWKQNIQNQIKAKKKALLALNIKNQFIKTDYEYGQQFSEYVPTVAKAIRNLLSQL